MLININQIDDLQHQQKIKSNSSAGAVRVEANLPGTTLTLKVKVKVTDYNVHSGAIRWRISTSVKDVRGIFATVLTVSEILTFQMCDLENIDDGVQHSQ